MAEKNQPGRRVRIGIDVGGTFTDAVAIDDETLEILAQLKIPTTHNDPHGVAAGVIQAVQGVLERGGIDPAEVVFISHGTTQATNALLEGDVVPVGIVGMGSGLDGARARNQTQIEPIPLAQGKVLQPLHTFLDTGNGLTPEQVTEALQALVAQGAEAVVAAEAYSVDDPSRELMVQQAAQAMGLPASASYEISKRYGLKVRTRTAVINASILPRMTRTADMTEASVQAAGITAPLMIMRGDGGSMMVGEMRRRPILTLLSGPAAGVAGALMYAKVSDGLFLEVGGTSTDISLIKNGRVMVDYAEVGGHRTYLRSLDVRTVGVAGGSMIRVRDGRLVEVGPRSAHIAGLEYAAFADPEALDGAELEIFAPLPGDPEEYVAVRTARGERYALTLTDAANLLGRVGPDDYARGNLDGIRRAWAPRRPPAGHHGGGGGPPGPGSGRPEGDRTDRGPPPQVRPRGLQGGPGGRRWGRGGGGAPCGGHHGRALPDRGERGDHLHHRGGPGHDPGDHRALHHQPHRGGPPPHPPGGPGGGDRPGGRPGHRRGADRGDPRRAPGPGRGDRRHRAADGDGPPGPAECG